MYDRIKAVREAYRLTQREFGERLGVSRDVISNLEYERVQPKDVFIRHICEMYNINEQWLKTGNGEMFLSDPEEKSRMDEALAIFGSLQPEFQDCALEQIRKLALLQKKMENRSEEQVRQVPES